MEWQINRSVCRRQATHTPVKLIGGDIAPPGGFCKREARGVDLRPRPERRAQQGALRQSEITALTSPAPPCVRLAHCQSPFGAVVRLGAIDHWLDVGAPRPLKATGHKPSNLTAPFQISAATVFMSSIASLRFPALRSLRASSLAFAYFAINSCSNFAHSAGNSAHNPFFL